MPSVPRNLTVMLQNSDLIITWDPPASPNGVVSYEINITSTDLATGAVETLGESIVRDDSSRRVVFPVSMEPYVRYDVSVLAATVAGESEAVTASHTTPEGGQESHTQPVTHNSIIGHSNFVWYLFASLDYTTLLVTKN